MSSTLAAASPQSPESLSRPAVGTLRLAVGLIQGAILYYLHRVEDLSTWPVTQPLLFAAVLLVAGLVPILIISGLGHMSRKQLLAWACIAAAIIAALACHDMWRVSDLPNELRDGRARARMPSGILIVFLCGGFFIAHSLVMAGIREGRRIASYASHFEIAWKFVIQLAFSAAFVGVVWLVLHLGTELFLLIKLSFLRDLVREAWFAIPVTSFAFACAMHLTDVRPAIVQGIRTLLLVLMSWVLPVITLVVGAFILTLPFTGLESLWATGHATALLLGTAAFFVVLINAAWQDGTAGTLVAAVIRLSAQACAVLLVPIVAIAIYALVLRVDDYGWTTDRLIAAAGLFIASLYALGYAAGAWRAGWLTTIPKVNIATSFAILAVLLVMFSPVGDPARLSVQNQVSRLAAGVVTADKFDFAYLRFDGARYGRDALIRLRAQAAGSDAAITRERIDAVRRMKGTWDRQARGKLTPDAAIANITLWPGSARLPASFRSTDWATHEGIGELPDCLSEKAKKCDAYLLDLTGDGKQEVILVGTTPGVGTGVLSEDEHGKWKLLARLPYYVSGCESLRKQLVAGSLRAVTPALQDIDIGGVRFEVNATGDPPGCPAVPAAGQPPTSATAGSQAALRR